MYVYHIYIYMIMIYVSVTKFDMRWKKENVLNFLEDGNCSQLVKGELCKTTSNGAQELAAISASRDWTYLLYCLFLRQQLQRERRGANRKEIYLKVKVEPPKGGVSKKLRCIPVVDFVCLGSSPLDFGPQSSDISDYLQGVFILT